MEQEILNKIEKQEEKLDKIYSSVEKTRKYFLFTMIATIVVVVLPIFGLVFMIPKFLSLYTDVLNF